MPQIINPLIKHKLFTGVSDNHTNLRNMIQSLQFIRYTDLTIENIDQEQNSRINKCK